jgi:hypothetical protein
MAVDLNARLRPLLLLSMALWGVARGAWVILINMYVFGLGAAALSVVTQKNPKQTYCFGSRTVRAGELRLTGSSWMEACN